MKRILATLLALLCAVAPLPAFAEMKAEATLVYSMVGLFVDHNPIANLIAFGDGHECILIDSNGDVITTPIYPRIHPNFGHNVADSGYFAMELNGTQDINCYGILNPSGQLISTTAYGDINYLSERWTAGIVIEKGTAAPFDYTGQQVIKFVDIFYYDAHVATLTRAQYNAGIAPHGDYLYLRSPHGVIDRTGTHTSINSSGFSYGLEFHYEFDTQTFIHNGTGQTAFTADCTLSPDEVVKSILLTDDGSILDLQGNVLFTNPELAGTASASPYEVIQGKYFIVDLYGSKGYYMFDLQGNVIAYGSDIADSNNSHNAVMASGYQLFADIDGNLHYVDQQGQETCSFTLPEGVSANSASLNYNLPFLFYQNPETSLYTVITAAVGQLPTEYESIVSNRYQGYASASPLLGVRQNGKVGVIDIFGNTIIDFQYYSMQMSRDGSLLLMRRDSDNRSAYDVYRIDYTDPAAEEAARLEAEAAAQAAAAEEAARLEAEAAEIARLEAEAERIAAEQAAAAIWHCDACDRDNDTNFCPGCGTARPVPPPVCSSCGYEAPDASYRFCPNCGQAF